MSSRILMLGANRRMLSMLLLVLVTLGTGMGLPNLRVDTGFSSLISNTDPDKMVYDRVADEFGSDNRSIVYIRDTGLWSPDKLAALERLHHTLEGLDFVERVDDLFNLRSIRGVEGEIDSRIFMPEAPKDQKTANQARDNALYNPLVVGNFLSRDGTSTAMMVSVREGRDDDDFDRRVHAALERAIAPARTTFQEVFQSGSARMKAELSASLFDDLVLLGPLSAFVLVVASIFFLRSVFAA
ncbi:MAG: MMPL family transporter, partial [Gammaproteobacteria bacterium]|nr:MMPL family transporter [Gammaproteobacteria bacterium]